MKERDILLIEDDPQVRRFIVSALGKEGFRIREAENGKAALEEFAAAGNVVLVISDIIMPEMEGLETINKLKKKRSDLPVIAISGGGRIDAASYLELALHMGADRVLEKPFTRGELIDAVASVLGPANFR